MLERLGGGSCLTPGEWLHVPQSVLTQSQYLSWKAEFYDRAEAMAKKNMKNLLSVAASWTADKICDRGKFADEEKQKGWSPGILAQTTQAALGAWRAIPSVGTVAAPLSKIIQRPQEPFVQFVGRLQEAAERVLGLQETEGLLVRHLAYENANSACRATLRGKMKDLDVSGMIKMCSDVDTLTHQVSKSVSLAIGAALQSQSKGLRASQTCFGCGQSGNFKKDYLLDLL